MNLGTYTRRVSQRCRYPEAIRHVCRWLHRRRFSWMFPLTERNYWWLSILDRRSDLPGSLWRVPSQGGPAKRVGNFEVTDASWSADGKKLRLFHDGRPLSGGKDGEDPRKLAGIRWFDTEAADFARWHAGSIHVTGIWSTVIVPCGKFPPRATDFTSYFRSGTAHRSIPMGSGRRMGSITCSIRTDRSGHCRSAMGF